MKILIKWMISLIFTLSILPYSHAFNEDPGDNQTSDDSLISEWGFSALTFKTINKDYDIEALGFPTSSDNVNSLNTSLLNKVETHQIKLTFTNKAFTANSGFSNKVDNQVNERSFFIQGSYQVLQQEKFTLLLTAKIESLHERSIYQFYSNDFVSLETPTTKVNGSTSYARFGILGQYSINNNWYLTGGLTSTAHEYSTNNELAPNMKKEQVALFGTTYTF